MVVSPPFNDGYSVFPCRVQSAPSDALRGGSDRTALRSVSATTAADVTLNQGSASVLKASLVTGGHMIESNSFILSDIISDKPRRVETQNCVIESLVRSFGACLMFFDINHCRLVFAVYWCHIK